MYNIALAAEKLERKQEVVTAYTRYLAESRNPQDKEQVKKRIEELKRELGEQDETAAETPTKATSEERGDESSDGPGAWPWVLIGSGAGLVVVGGVLMALAADQKSTVENADPGTRWSEVEGSYNSTPVLFYSGLAAAGVGVAAAGIGTAWLLFGGKKEESSDQIAFGFGGSSVSLSGKF